MVSVVLSNLWTAVLILLLFCSYFLNVVRKLRIVWGTIIWGENGKLQSEEGKKSGKMILYGPLWKQFKS